jgi:hypothetical protein
VERSDVIWASALAASVARRRPALSANKQKTL